MNKPLFLITGGAGFIGANFTHMLAKSGRASIVVADALTYAGNLSSISELIDSEAVTFHKADIRDKDAMASILEKYTPDYIVNFAAETHVDRSVDDPSPFVTTNVEGTFCLLEAARRQRAAQMAAAQTPTLKKFVQISTDEVYGDLEIGEPRRAPEELCERIGRDITLYGLGAFAETTHINPSSPYSASKASADMLALSYVRSFGLPVTVTRCSNNYGPYQFPEKLIPLVINNLAEHRPIPVYGTGMNVRDWIHVDDHCRGIIAAAENGKPGEVYCFGGYNECRNIDLVRRIIDIFAAITGTVTGPDAITFVTDRPGHDRRYAIDASKAYEHLGWRPTVSPAEGLADTVRWYVDNRAWVEDIVRGDYRNYYSRMYTNR